MSLKQTTMIVCGLLIITQFSCTKNANSSNPTIGTIKFSIRSISNGSLKKVSGAINTVTSVTSAQIVIEEIEFESSLGDSLNFQLEQPFVQDLMVGSDFHEIQNIQIPFGTYKESEIEIGKLDSGDGDVYNQNPELQDKSRLIKGYLNGNPNETFVFSSDLEEEQEREFSKPLILGENSPSTNIVMTINMDIWFSDSNGNPMDPRLASNRSIIAENIKNSIDIFEDEDVQYKQEFV